MCGIFAILNKQHDEKTLISHFIKGTSRGPENSSIEFLSNITLGFHRLAINGLNKSANQPLHIGECILICNGEIYNYKELHKLIDVPNSSGSDCEIIIHLYQKYGIEQTLQLLDGVYAFLLLDKNKVFVARDLFGVRPLFKMKSESGLGFASEIKMLTDNIEPFQPGTYSILKYDSKYPDRWVYETENKIFATINTPIQDTTEKKALELIRHSLTAAVKKRVFSTERPIACLLSGGLDSSLITALVHSICGNVETYSIGLKGSEDIKYARKVADYLGTKHTEIICTQKEFLDAIPTVIQNIESYDTTTVRASVGNYLVSKYISEHSDAKVIFNGDGSDEVCGGYMYFHYAPDSIAFDKECRRLLKDIHLFDVLRSDRSISSNGLEARTPFLDRFFVQSYLSLPYQLRFQKNKCEKYLLRKAFEPRFPDRHLLPPEVLFRTKEAFSDGVSSLKQSWFEIIQQHVSTLGTFSLPFITHNPPLTPEQKYYRYLFNKHYEQHAKVIPYFWMPRFIDATDSSARTLKIYKQKI